MAERAVSEAELQAMLRGLPTGVALIVSPGTIAWANTAYFATTGRTPAMLGRDFHELLEEDGTWAAPIRRAVDRALAEGHPSSFTSVRARYPHHPGGTYLDVDVRPLPAGGPEPPQALLVVRDVTDRVTEQLRAEVFYQSFRSSTNPMQLTDARGIMVDVNPAFERVYGYSREECIGRKPNLVRSRYTSPEIYERMWADLADPSRGFWSGELMNRDRNGRERPVLLSITAIRSARGAITHYLGVAVDLSEQRSWELQAAHGDRLASIGQLAAGVAHEINTPLANVLLVTESLRRRVQDPWVLSRLDTLSGQVEVAAGIVRGLLDFARRDEPHVSELDLAAVAQEGVDFLQGKQSVDLEIVLHRPETPVPVAGDRGQLIQVLTNLLNNAADAMGGHGRIDVHVRARAGRAELEVIDSGPGIPVEVLPRIFEPFFTTKPEGEGTGLGLAICHGIVQSHHGSIAVRNVPGAGAGFLISLPIVEDRRGTRPSPGGPGPS